jgi:lipoate-protein ligase A
MDFGLIVDKPSPGDWNMAFDEALLHSVGEAGQGGYLRFYFWEVPTLSLGYFQRHEDRRLHEPSRPCPMVRRSTGGGAIIHARELTYSFVIPTASQLDTRAEGMYLAFHETLIDELSAQGIAAELCRNPTPVGKEPFLCFLRRADGDVLLDGNKIAGSAQRRHRCALLQHGSVLLATTPNSPELAGVQDLANVQLDPHDFVARWTQRIQQRLNLRLRRKDPPERVLSETKKWCDCRFSTSDWNCKR